MPTYNDYGIVLKSYDLSEADKIFHIYTKENGLVRAVGKSVKLLSSRISGKLDLLSCLYFQFAKGKNLDIISDLEQINCFPKLRSDSTRLFYGILFLDIVNNFAHEGESESQETYELLYSALDELQKESNIELFTVKFILNFLSLHGFKPQLETCVACSKKTNINQRHERYPYSGVLGGLLCRECITLEHKMISISVLDIIYNTGNTAAVMEKAQSENNNIRDALKLLQEHLNLRAKKEIKTFDLVFSL